MQCCLFFQEVAMAMVMVMVMVVGVVRHLRISDLRQGHERTEMMNVTEGHTAQTGRTRHTSTTMQPNC